MKEVIITLLILSSACLYANEQPVATEQDQQSVEIHQQVEEEVDELVLTDEEHRALNNHIDAGQSSVLGY